MGIFTFLIPADVRAVVSSMDAHPSDWSPSWIGRKLYVLTHNSSGLHVWAANRPYGVDIREKGWGRILWGDVTLLSSLMLSPGHWALSNAIGRWISRAHTPSVLAKQSASDILARSTQS